jgi:hypothetical protein
MATENSKKFNFQTVLPQQGRSFDFLETKGEKKFIKFGNDNLFPQHLIELYNKSSIHAAAVNAITEAVVGEGLTANVETYLDRANSHGETWNDIFAKLALDFKLYGSYAFEVIWSNDRTKIAEVFHIDFSYLRAEEKNFRGHVPGYFISSEWDKNNRYVTTGLRQDIPYLPIFNESKKYDEPNQIFVMRSYRPGQDYYPLPDYMAALKVIELDTEIDNFHVNNINNGLAPSLAITTFMNGSEDQIQAVRAQLQGNYGGSSNAGSLIYMDVDAPENAPVITPIAQNGADSYYENVNDMTTQKILTAHRITSPMILGIKTDGQLGGRQEVLDAYLLLQNTVIAPFQQDLLRSLETIMQVNYPDIVLGVIQKKLFADGEEQEEVVTSAEATDQEDADLQQPENLG